MKTLLVGLGNPGTEYKNTRHNVGFMFLDYLEAHDHPGSWKLERADTYMNQSGLAVKKFIKKHAIKPARLVVTHDDLDIEFGKFRVSFERNSAGHRGVQNIIEHLKTNKFWRIRIGIANPKLKKMRAAGTVADFVLSKFTPTEISELNNIFKTALHGLSDHLDHA
ncbi:MAG: aminoacyl-tRNA hydrolase [Patescibacteria group bacterium]